MLSNEKAREVKISQFRTSLRSPVSSFSSLPPGLRVRLPSAANRVQPLGTGVCFDTSINQPSFIHSPSNDTTHSLSPGSLGRQRSLATRAVQLHRLLETKPAVAASAAYSLLPHDFPPSNWRVRPIKPVWYSTPKSPFQRIENTTVLHRA